jgi:pyruvate/2-oxoglutarate dehydrogenase complex dihydrolipoamide dehydrogenase (E3) component
MTESQLLPDLCVLGGGAAGQVVAAGASQMGASVVLVEAGAMGGAGLHGAAASQALLAAAAVPGMEWPAALQRVHRTLDALSANVSVERLEGLGVQVLQGHGRFTSPGEVRVEGVRVCARRFVIATGAAPALPPEHGDALTAETIFSLAERPDTLAVLGGGPIALELAQAFRRLGSTVTLHAPRPLPDEDEELADSVVTALRREGIAVSDSPSTASATVLAALERRPRLAGLNLDAAGVLASEHGIKVDAGLRTSNRRIYAIGDVTGGPQSVALATAQAGLVLRSALFRLPVRNDLTALPRVVHTDPGLARVGPNEAEARALHGKVEILRWAMADTDRAVIDGRRDGLAKVLLDRRGRVIGAAIAGPRAAELILPWTLAVRRRLPIGDLAGLMVPYPTLSEVSRKVATSALLPKLFSDRVKRVVGWLARLP